MDRDRFQIKHASSECCIPRMVRRMQYTILQYISWSHSLLVQWVIRSIPHGGLIELFLIPASAP